MSPQDINTDRISPQDINTDRISPQDRKTDEQTNRRVFGYPSVSWEV